jgi:protein gp37
MGENSGIQWTHHTFNPWVGCQRVSPGCENCYAEAYDKRVGGALVDGTKQLRWGPKAPRVRTSAANWKKPLQWNKRAQLAGVRERVFCASLADVFELNEHIEPNWRLELFSIIRQTPALDWLLLTKRPENFEAALRSALEISARHNGYMESAEAFEETRLWLTRWLGGDPPFNVWLGTTVEDQQRANERIPRVIEIPAAVRFLSMEPLLEGVDLDPLTCPNCGEHEVFWGDEPGSQPWCSECDTEMGSPGWLSDAEDGIDWVIIGGESGGKARPFDVQWARDLVKQCRAAGVAPFVKQLGTNVRDRNDAGFDAWGEVDSETKLPTNESAWPASEEYGGHIRVEDIDTGYQGAPVRVHLGDHHGGDPAEWPLDLRVREFPEVRR